MSKYSKDLIPVEFVNFLIYSFEINEDKAKAPMYLRALLSTWESFADNWDKFYEILREVRDGQQ